MKNLVSVIIPSYNHEKYIKDCVMSVINQTYRNLEIIIIDDCSSDNSSKILKSIKDDRIKLFCSKKNKGTVKTVNELMKKCQGKYIAIIGSDDIWDLEKIEKQVKYLNDNKHIGAVFTGAQIIDENGCLYEDDESFNDNVFKLENMSSGQRMRRFFEQGNHLCHSSSLIRKEVVKKIGLYDIAYRQLHDYDYWVRLINEYNIYIMSEKLVKYRRFKNSKQNLSNNSQESMIRVINETNAIVSWMFHNIKNNIFKEGFSDLFKNKDSKTEEELLCEKYFILLKYEIIGSNNKQIAFSLVYNNPNKDHLLELLENKYHYTLNDFYDDTGKVYDVFNYNYYLAGNSEISKVMNNDKEIMKKQENEIQKCHNKIEESNAKIHNLDLIIHMVQNSLSWKITKPLRYIKGLIKK